MAKVPRRDKEFEQLVAIDGVWIAAMSKRVFLRATRYAPRRARELAVRIKEPGAGAYATGLLGEVACRRGAPDVSRALLTAGLRQAEALGLWPAIGLGTLPTWVIKVMAGAGTFFILLWAGLASMMNVQVPS